MFNHTLTMEISDDVNDTDFDIILEILRNNLKDFTVYYADGNYVNFSWN